MPRQSNGGHTTGLGRDQVFDAGPVPVRRGRGLPAVLDAGVVIWDTLYRRIWASTWMAARRQSAVR